MTSKEYPGGQPVFADLELSECQIVASIGAQLASYIMKTLHGEGLPFERAAIMSVRIGEMIIGAHLFAASKDTADAERLFQEHTPRLHEQLMLICAAKEAADVTAS